LRYLAFNSRPNLRKDAILLQNLLFFVLGICVAGLFALWLAPYVWRRAARVTERRIEAAIPLSVHEVRAEKDQMRAAFAVDLRDIELKNEALQRSTAENRVAINTHLETIDRLEAKVSQGLNVISENEERIDALQLDVQRRVEVSTKLKSDLNAAQAKLEERNERVRELTSGLNRSESDLNAARIELAALQTRAENASDKLQKATHAARTFKKSNADLKSELKLMQDRLNRQSKDVDHAQKLLASAKSQIADFEERVERRDREIQRLKSRDAAAPKTSKIAAKSPAKIASKTSPKSAPPKRSADIAAKEVDSAAAAIMALKADAASLAPDVPAEVDQSVVEELANLHERLEAASAKMVTSGDRPNAGLMTEMTEISARITALSGVGEAADAGQPASRRLKGFKAPQGQDNSASRKPTTLSQRIAAMQNINAAE
jgi:chromosome segregation ATPase